ncbi:MAG: sodium/pantothenate symporter [Desulfohalobiaceae bacterium]
MPDLNLLVLLPLVLYLLLIYILAAYSNRILARSGNFLEEYFIGSRGMGGFVLAMTLVATYTSASSFVGGPGVAYQMGLGWVLLAMIQVPTAWLTLGILGKKFAIIARRVSAVTISDILRARYENRWVVALSSLALVVFFLAAMVAQFIGGARLFEGAVGLSYHAGLFIFAASVILYTTVGGFRAVALTDAVQGLVMLAGMGALLWGVLQAGGGMEAIVQDLKSTDPALVTPFGPDNFLSKPFILSFWILVGLGVIGLPHAGIRCFGYRSSRAMHRAIVLSTAVLGLILLGLHLAGALGRAVVPGLEVGDKIMPLLSLEVLPPVVAGLFLAGPMAAIMSTIDSQLILASGTLLKDIYIHFFHPQDSQGPAENRRLHRISFYSTALLGLIVFLAALKPPDLIVWLNLFAFGGLQAAFFWPLVLGLYWKRANSAGALASIIVGVGTFFILNIFMDRFWDMHVIVPTLTLGGLAFFLVSLVTAPPSYEVQNLFWGRNGN